MREFSRTLESLEKTKATSEKVAIVADYLASGSEEDLELKARFLSGQPLPRGSGEPLGFGWSLILEALLEAGALAPGWENSYRSYGDLGEAIFHLLEEKGWKPEGTPVTLGELEEFFREQSLIKGGDSRKRKKLLFLNLLRRLTPLEAKFLLRLISRDMRVGLKENLVEAAISKAFGLSLKKVREANLLISDIGKVALLLSKGKLEKLTLIPGNPFKFMLAETAPSSQELFSKENREYLAEDKYDGIRAQLHASFKKVWLFSRNLEEISGNFPEIVQAMEGFPGEIILDGEIVAFKGRALPFLHLQQRLHRIDPERIKKQIPVSFFVFDLLLLNGDSLLSLPLKERRELLSSLPLPEPLRLAHQEKIRSPEEMEKAFSRSRERGNEGLVLKDPDSPYSPGKRGKQWLKFKKELSTLDCVVVRAEWGHGKRAGLLSDLTFAVRDRKGNLLTIGKAFSGLTDSEIKELTEWFREHALEDEGWGFKVEPKLVIEVAFNGIQRSSRHESGYALRFPRIKGIRKDKTVEEISTIDEVEMIFKEGGFP
ncbi:MAG: ATP-dependent DNA ligase [Caldiserica bacterium]|nr:ATP-dependent DNA ligase [Caldisericota bacterium]MDH7562581.1 ATP-dependent DNA ligase [Caldisericota bacterium]